MPQKTPLRPKSPTVHIACICSRGDEVIVSESGERWVFPEVAVRHGHPLADEAVRLLGSLGQNSRDLAFVGAVDDLRLNRTGSLHTHHVYIVATSTCDQIGKAELLPALRWERVSSLAALQTEAMDWSAAILAQYVREHTGG